MKKYFNTKKIIIIIASIIVATIVPFAINELYRVNDGYITIWGAEDVFSFYGDLLGAIATIGAVYLTIDYSVYREQQNYKKTICPFLSTSYFPQYDYEDFMKKKENVLYVNIERNGDISISQVVPEKIKQIKRTIDANQKIDLSKVETNEVRAAIKNNYQKEIDFLMNNYVMEYSLENYGGGNALEVEMRINGKKIMQPFAISTHHQKIYRLVVDVSDVVLEGEYLLNIEYTYYDQTRLGKYSQKECIHIARDKDKTLTSAQSLTDFISVPEEIVLKEG